MREILFRGKRVDNGEWVEGCLQTNGEEAVISWYISFHIGVCWDCASPAVDFFEVILETVGQYTGLKDKNGKMIFEGDIIKPKRKDGDNDDMWIFNNFQVVFNDGCWELNNCSRGNFLLNFQPCDIEIIGNIHDNPELMKMEKKE